MYEGFNLIVDEFFFDEELDYRFFIEREKMEALYNRNSEKVRSKIQDLIRDDGSLSAKDILSSWFELDKYDIFISHSHSDKDLAIKLATWLKVNLNLNCFIDSCVWGNFVKLAKDLNNNYSINKNSSFTYDYDKAQNVFTHVNALLNTSLTNMIDKCEGVFFLNTDNSISESNYQNDDITLSPWIYHELLITKVIKKKILRPSLEHRIKNEAQLGLDSINESLRIEYTAEVSHLFELDDNSLLKWKKNYNQTTSFQIHALDILYSAMKRKEIYG